MKKILIIITLFIILISGEPHGKNFSLNDYFSGEYYSYSSEPLTDNYINIGTCYMNFGEVKGKSSIIGESMIIKNFEPIAALKQLNAKLIKTENLENGAVVFYAYTNLNRKCVKIDGNKVNIQIACYDDHSVIGWPLILGSF